MSYQSITFNPTYKTKAVDYTGFEDITSTASAIGLALDNLNLLTPAGALYPFAGDVAPTGFFICDGSAVDRVRYARLFSVLGTKYGSGDGSTTFTLPDLRSRVIAGYNSGVSYYNAVGKTGGNNTHAITVPELPAHNHTASSNTTGAHNHNGTTTQNGDHNHNGTTTTNGDHNHDGTTSTNGSHTHTSNAIGGQGNYGLALADGTKTVINTDSSNGELNVWTLPEALTINDNGDHNHTYTTSTNGAHNHDYTTSTNGLHDHTYTTSTNGDHSHVITVNNTGGGNAIELLQPYITMNYIIKY